MRIRVTAIAAAVVATMLLAAPAAAAEGCRDQDSDRQIEACTKAIDTLHGKAQAEAYMFRGRAWSRKTDYDRALADYGAALRVDPTYALAVNGRAIVLYRQGKFDDAIAAFNDAIRLTPKDGALHCNLGTVFRDKGALDRAIAEYTEAVRLDPRLFVCLGNRGEAWRLAGDLDHALADQDEAIRGDASLALPFVERGDTLRYRGDLQRALADYDRALRLESDYIPALTGKGLAYEKTGDLVRARAEFEKALASKHRLANVDVHRSARETAAAQIAAIDSGSPLPVIPNAPARVEHATTIPTPIAKPPTVTSAVHQGRRIALVIGNSAYQNVTALPNPEHDAAAVAAAFRAVGFETVTLVQNATRQALIDKLRAFGEQSEAADWAVVYYAGHGIEFDGANYLIPVDAKISANRDAQFETVRLDQVLASVEGAKKLKLVLLDACRDNPFVPRHAPRPIAAGNPEIADAGTRDTGARDTGTRSIGRGLAEVRVNGATLVVYAAKHGEVALDGEGGDSPFAVAFVQRIATPGVEINKLFRLVRDDVMEATAGRQEPYTYGSLPGNEDFYFVAR
jgi:tetratricopeptide (TPR) repeat protein